MTLAEPATFATDLGLFALSAIFSRRLLGAAGPGPPVPPVRTWGAGFAALAWAALFGALEHGIGPSLGPAADAILWRASLLGLCAAALALLVAGVGAGVPPLHRPFLVALSILGVGTGTGFVLLHGRFALALLVYGGALVATFVVLSAAPGTRRGAARWWVLGGVLVSGLAGWIQQDGPDLHPAFNHNDLYHVVQAPGLWLLYRGGRALPPS